MATPTTQSFRVLIIDDSLESLALFSTILENAGYEAVSVYDGKQALEKLRTQDFDLAILDNDMPRLGGIETLTEVRDFFPGLPVIICSGMITEREMTRYRELGITEILHKPVETRHLLAKVSAALCNRDRLLRNGTPPLPTTRHSTAPFAPALSPLFAGTSQHAFKLQENFQRLRTFRSVAILEGPRGSGCLELALGLAPSLHVHTIICPVDDFSLDQLDTLLGPAVSDNKPVFMVLLNADRLTPARQLLLENLVRGRIDHHADISQSLRLVLCARTSLCSQDFNEFLLMRAVAFTRPLPPFSERRQDWPEIARAILRREHPGGGKFETTAIRWIQAQAWPGDYRQLHRVIELAHRHAGLGATLTEAHLEEAFLAEAHCTEPLFHDRLCHLPSGY